MAFIGYHYINVYRSLNEKINWVMEHYAPTNLSISGTTILGTSTTIGQDDTNNLTVNSTSIFESPTTFNNTLTAMEETISPHFTIPIVSDNSLRMGSDNLILYHECDNDINLMSDTDYTNSVIVKIKNIHTTNTISITYNSSSGSVTLVSGGNITFIKTSISSFTRIY